MSDVTKCLLLILLTDIKYLIFWLKNTMKSVLMCMLYGGVMMMVVNAAPSGQRVPNELKDVDFDSEEVQEELKCLSFIGKTHNNYMCYCL